MRFRDTFSNAKHQNLKRINCLSLAYLNNVFKFNSVCTFTGPVVASALKVLEEVEGEGHLM